MSTVTAVDWGNLTQSRSNTASASSETYGYTQGGEAPGYGQPTNDKFPFASNAGASDVGDLTQSGNYNGPAGHSSSTHGYTSVGTRMSPHAHDWTIDKFSFASGGDSTSVGNLTVKRYSAEGISMETHGYACGGNTGSQVDTIDYFSFDSDGDGADWEDLSATHHGATGTQTSTHAYLVAGYTDNTRMEKFQFASAVQATDYADLAVGRNGGSGSQY